MPNKTFRPKHLGVSKGAQGERNFSEKEDKIVSAKHFLSSDVQKAALTSLTTNWKEDQDEQLRVGTWAVHVLAGQVDSIPTELLRGMKSDALKALGRLSMQLLAASAASATSESQPLLKGEVGVERAGQKYTGTQMAGEAFENLSNEKDALEINRVVENISHLSKAAIKGSNEFFRMENIQSDLQALQNNIQLDFTADVLVDGFIEALKHDTLEESIEMRSDILSSVLGASQHLVDKSKSKSSSSVPMRAQQVTFDTESMTGTSDKKRKFQIVHEESEGIVLDLGNSLQEQKQVLKDTSKNSKDLGFEQSILNQEEGKGGWTNIPQSKFLE
jgi:hypothetical protein